MNPLTTVNSNAYVALGKKLYVNKKQKKNNRPNKSSSTNITSSKRKRLTEIDEAPKIGEEIRTQSDAQAIGGEESTDVTTLRKLKTLTIAKSVFPNTSHSESPASSSSMKSAEKLKESRSHDPNIANSGSELPCSTDWIVAKPEFAVKEIVWSKLRGHSHWPARIERIVSNAAGTKMFDVVWFNDYRRSRIYRLQVFKFLENFEKFAIKFDDVVGLKTAAFEAMYCYRKENFH